LRSSFTVSESELLELLELSPPAGAAPPDALVVSPVALAEAVAVVLLSSVLPLMATLFDEGVDRVELIVTEVMLTMGFILFGLRLIPSSTSKGLT
jgi:hypothetical protein